MKSWMKMTLNERKTHERRMKEKRDEELDEDKLK